MAEIFDLIAKIGWDANSKELERVTGIMKDQDKVLEELRRKGGRLEDQIRKTNDPKLLKAYNDQLQEMRKRADAITTAQKQQLTITESLRKKQKELHEQLRANNDPKMVQGLLQNLGKVENQLTSLTAKASASGTKLGGIMKDFAGGLGLGAGLMGAGAIASGVSSFFHGAIQEAEEAESGLLRFKQTLENIGKGGLFDELVNQADTLANSYKNLFDNDDILAGQAKFIEGTRITKQGLKEIMPVAIELAAKLGTDVTTASEMLVNSLIGRTSPELKRLGLNMKDAKTETERLALITGDFANLLDGSVNTSLETAAGKTQQLQTKVKNLQEEIGTGLLPLKSQILSFFSEIIDGTGEMMDDWADAPYWQILVDPIGFFRTDQTRARAREKMAKETWDDLQKVQDSIEMMQRQGVPRVNPVLKALKDREAELMAKSSNEILNENAGLDEEQADKAVKKTARNLKKAVDKYTPNISQGTGEGLTAPSGLNFNLPSYQGNLASEQLQRDVESARAVNEVLQTEQDIANQISEDAEREHQAELTEIAREEQKKRNTEYRQMLFQQVKDLAQVANDLLRQEQDKTSRLISEQEDRVDAAKNAQDKGAKASVKIEEDRLNELIKKRQQYERTQRIIDAAVIVANQAVAISGAIRQIATAKNPILIAANVAAILAGIGASVVAVRSAFSDGTAGFREGGYTGDGNPDEVSTAKGQRGYKYHRREFIMTQQLTDKHRELFEGIHTGKLNIKKTNDGYYIGNEIDTDKAVSDYHTARAASFDTSNMVYELQSIKRALGQREVTVNNNFDEEGFSTAIASKMGEIQIRKNLSRI